MNLNRDNGKAQLLDAIKKEKNLGMIGVSSIITQYRKVKDLGRILKAVAPKVPLVMGGPGPTSMPEMYLQHCSADIVTVGEGEETVKELVQRIDDNDSLEFCEGIVFNKGNGLIMHTAPRTPIADINVIPLPAWHLIDQMPVYTKNFLFRCGRKNGMSIFSTRGCPGKCIYCMCNFGRRLRMRSAENIACEIEYLINTYSIEHIHFLDDTFVTSTSRTEEICDMFEKRFPRITWSANVRADFVRKEVLQRMGHAGCIFLAYGIESASPEVLEYMDKRVTPEQARKAIRWTREAGIEVRAYFMIGMPCETPQTLQETVEFCKENMVGGEFFFVTPIPGTTLYDYARQKGLIKNEDVYLELVGEVRDFLVNLTDMSNEELFTLKEKAENEIQDHLRANGFPVPTSVRKDPRVTAANLPVF